ncbi:MAG TPA: response regulator transcription factor [Chryseosolibacter sp.]
MTFNPNETQLKIVLADDFQILVERLKKMLNPISHLTVIGEAYSMSSAVSQVEQMRPDVVIMDIQLGGTEPKNGIALINIFKRTYPNLTIIVFTNFADTRYHQLCLMNGADYFFDKAAGADAITDALDEVSRTKKILS